MAIANATMTVTITESVSLNGTNRGNTITKTISNIHDVMERIITVPTSEITLYSTHASAVAGSTFDLDFIKYVRITNKDASNYIILRVTNAESDEFAYKLAAGESFILHGHAASTEMSAAGGAGAPDQNITSVEAQANSGACDVELIVASVNS
tara:strand:+ start:1766 stop:2224 length:459 start_codon:yes stop_codon:yes gene_type:complete